MYECDLFCLFFFFFSSRRRHTRFDCDWSSDVCSSDLSARVLQDSQAMSRSRRPLACFKPCARTPPSSRRFRSEEHTSELQSQSNLVCRLLLEKKKKKKQDTQYSHETHTHKLTIDKDST